VAWLLGGFITAVANHPLRAEDVDVGLATNHPLVIWYDHQKQVGKLPNVKYKVTPAGRTVTFSPLGNQLTSVTAGFDFRLASDGDFLFSLQAAFQVPKGEQGGSLILAIPFNSPDESALRVTIMPSYDSEHEVMIVAHLQTSEGVVNTTRPIQAIASRGTIEVQRKQSKVRVSFSPVKGDRIESDEIEVPKVPIRPISLWMRCSPKSTSVSYDLLRFKAKTERSPVSLPAVHPSIDWFKWCAIGFGAMGSVAVVLKLLRRS